MAFFLPILLISVILIAYCANSSRASYLKLKEIFSELNKEYGGELIDNGTINGLTLNLIKGEAHVSISSEVFGRSKFYNHFHIRFIRKTSSIEHVEYLSIRDALQKDAVKSLLNKKYDLI